MASPQLEDGHTLIANELLEALCRYCPGFSNGQVYMSIIRKTYGFHKKEDSISIGQIMEMTGLSRRSVIYSLQNLEAQKMITIERSEHEVNSIAIQKDYEQWIPTAKCLSYSKNLEIKREKYNNKVVQRIDIYPAPPMQTNEPIVALVQPTKGSATKVTDVVQRIDKKCQIVAPTKDNIQKIITKDIYIPDWINGELWDAFMEVRKQKKTPNTETAIKLLINKLTRAKDDGDDPNKLLEEAIVGGWKSVVTSKERNKNNDHKTFQSDKSQPATKRYEVVN